MSTARVDVWIWSLIYFGMIMLTLGISVRQTSGGFNWISWLMGGFGVVIAGVGAVLIWIRSRMKESAQDPVQEGRVAEQLEKENP
jgi:hypothetical protein